MRFRFQVPGYEFLIYLSPYLLIFLSLKIGRNTPPLRVGMKTQAGKLDWADNQTVILNLVQNL